MRYTEEELYQMYKSSLINEDTFIIGLYLLDPHSYIDNTLINKDDFYVKKYKLDNFHKIIDQYKNLLDNPSIYEFKELFKDISFLEQIDIFNMNKVIKLTKEVSSSREGLILKSSLKREKEETLESIKSEKLDSFVCLFIQKLKSGNLTDVDVSIIKKLPFAYSNGFLIAKTLLLFKEHSFLWSYIEEKSTFKDIENLLKKHAVC